MTGLFRRLAVAQPAAPVINIVITDGHETCQKGLPVVGKLTAPTVVILLPEQERSETATPSDEQFSVRQEAIAQALPSAAINDLCQDQAQQSRSLPAWRQTGWNWLDEAQSWWRRIA